MEQDRWTELYDRDLDEEVEHVRAAELRRLERLDEKGLPHPTGPAFLCEPCECGGQCDKCQEAA